MQKRVAFQNYSLKFRSVPKTNVLSGSEGKPHARKQFWFEWSERERGERPENGGKACAQQQCIDWRQKIRTRQQSAFHIVRQAAQKGCSVAACWAARESKKWRMCCLQLRAACLSAFKAGPSSWPQFPCFFVQKTTVGFSSQHVTLWGILPHPGGKKC